MKVGVLGSGDVAKTLAGGFLKHGHQVMIGSRSPEKLTGWLQENPTGSTGTFAEAAAFGDAVMLAVKGTAALEALELGGGANLAGKTVMDATNPIADAPPVNDVLQFFTGPNESLLEKLQAAFPEAHLVKVFNSVGNILMINPQVAGGVKPTMFICGNDDAAKKQVSGILDQFGWDTEDCGKAEAARAIEPLCILWCIPGFMRNDWMHAFKVLR
ncbi:MAG TPA: NAD(P)-binding domain-containing protein [Terracidiphilus sp.]|jgi:8-hydroxy-5-deazaflavin:NADPH oxidoreductase